MRVSFELPNGTRGGGALLSTALAKEEGFYIRLNPDFAQPAFLHDHQFRISVERRKTIKGMLGQWLHDFLSTHSVERELTVGYLRHLSGYTGKKKNFLPELREACAELARAAPALVHEFNIERRGRSSDNWAIRISRGAEKPEFIMPEAIQRVERPVVVDDGNARGAPRKRPSANRGRVAL